MQVKIQYTRTKKWETIPNVTKIDSSNPDRIFIESPTRFLRVDWNTVALFMCDVDEGVKLPPDDI